MASTDPEQSPSFDQRAKTDAGAKGTAQQIRWRLILGTLAFVVVAPSAFTRNILIIVPFVGTALFVGWSLDARRYKLLFLTPVLFVVLLGSSGIHRTPQQLRFRDDVVITYGSGATKADAQSLYDILLKTKQIERPQAFFAAVTKTETRIPWHSFSSMPTLGMTRKSSPISSQWEKP